MDQVEPKVLLKRLWSRWYTPSLKDAPNPTYKPIAVHRSLTGNGYGCQGNPALSYPKKLFLNQSIIETLGFGTDQATP